MEGKQIFFAKKFLVLVLFQLKNCTKNFGRQFLEIDGLETTRLCRDETADVQNRYNFLTKYRYSSLTILYHIKMILCRTAVILAMILSSLISNSFCRILNRLILRMNSGFSLTYNNIGDSDLKVSNVCLGTMTFGQQNTEEEGIAQLDLACNTYGVNFIDTAEMYPTPRKPETQGATDRTIGKWLEKQDRSKLIPATKVAGRSKQLSWLPGRDGKPCRVSYKEILASVDYSLQRLKTDYIDILQIHWPDRYVSLFGGGAYDVTKERDYISFEEQLRAFEYLHKAGKVRYFGVSNETPYGVMKFTQVASQFNFPKIISIQNSFSLLVRSDFEAGLIEVCSPRHENIGLLAYSPLAGGVLTGKYLDPACPSTSRLNLFPGFMER